MQIQAYTCKLAPRDDDNDDDDNDTSLARFLIGAAN